MKEWLEQKRWVNNMKKILLVDDSALMRRVLSDIINGTNEYIVAYTAANGVEGLNLIKTHDDIMAVFCDIHMPQMNGTELLKEVKTNGYTVPFVMISSSEDVNDTITALDLGALEFIKKPEKIFDRNMSEYAKNVVKALKMADEVSKKSKNRTDISSNVTSTKTYSSESKKIIPSKKRNINKKTLIALVCSTGGPKALQQVIPKLPKDLSVPMVLVQHMPANFTATMAERLNELSQINVKEAEDGELLKAGTVYIAKGGTHLTVKNDRIVFSDAPPVVGLKPCGNLMYESLINCDYEEIICVVLTGMGADGTKGIVKLSKQKKVYVIAQDEQSSTVYGMPRAIYESGVTDLVCSLGNIADEIVKKVGV